MRTPTGTGYRAVDYHRYSSDNQRDASIEDQARICQERIRNEGWEHVRSYQDRAMSGASRLRPAYQRLLEDARRREFDVVVAESLDRLSRDQEDVAHLFKHLTFVGVRLFTLSEGWISELHVGLSGTMGALYLKHLAEKTKRGLRGRVEAGRSGGGNSYGYDIVKTLNPAGESERGLREKNDKQAAIVVEIMSQYAAGKSPRAIAKALNMRGVPGPSGGTWSPSAITGNNRRGTGILNNELYIGRIIWNRLRYVKNPTTGKRESRLNDADDWTRRDAPELRIVSQELWDAVKTRQRDMTRDTRPSKTATGTREFWKLQRPRFLLSGLMKCGCCGANYTKYGANRFACAGARDRATCTNSLTIRGDILEESILAGLKTRLMEPAQFEQFARAFVAETNRQRGHAQAAKVKMRADIAAIDRQIKRLVDAILEGADALPLNGKLKELDAEKSRLSEQLDATPEDKPLLHPALAATYRDCVAELAAALYDDLEGRQAFELIRSMIEEVRLTPVAGQLTIELRGDLAGILRIIEGGKQRLDIADEKALQIKMVAGARNSRRRGWVESRETVPFHLIA
jgi:DNA invertase Pin-like site-specific DNA recombinase